MDQKNFNNAVIYLVRGVFFLLLMIAFILFSMSGVITLRFYYLVVVPFMIFSIYASMIWSLIKGVEAGFDGVMERDRKRRRI